MQLTALLPMKGHSERVPNKNMRLFAGRPLYHRIAQILQKSAFIDSIVINTDSDIIAGDALCHFSKTKIHVRPEHIRGDFVPMNEIIKYDIERLPGEHFLQTHSTNPLLTKKSLERGIEAYFGSAGKYDSVFSVTKWRSRFYWSSGEPINHSPDELLRTQDLAPIYEENSNFYIFSRSAFHGAGNRRIGLSPNMLIINKFEGIDIDQEDDFRIAEALAINCLITKDDL
jgi:CMP-N-acetylneuraminic acid synthetase